MNISKNLVIVFNFTPYHVNRGVGLFENKRSFILVDTRPDS